MMERLFFRNLILIACKRNSSHQFGVLRTVVFAAVNVKTTRSLDVTPCSLVHAHLCFGNILVFSARLTTSLNINAAIFSKTSVNFYQTTHHHIPEYRCLTLFNFMRNLYIRCVHI
jgi:hypothetical protein